MASSFVLGRSEFNHIRPGTVVPFQIDGSFGRIQSVQLDNMCLDVEPEQPYPVDRDCNPIEVRKIDLIGQPSTCGYLYWLSSYVNNTQG